MSRPNEPWIRAALTDDSVVADLLVRLRGSSQQPPTTTTVTPLKWTVRQRRSRPPTKNDSSKEESSRHHHHRASPTTPLSLSAGTSQDGSEESTRRSHAHVGGVSCPAKPKVSEDVEKAVSKKSRKRKTLAELKCEESSLMREGIELKREIAAMRVNLKKQWAENENLKRMKKQRQLIPDSEMVSIISPQGVAEADASLRHSYSDRKNVDFSPCKIFAIPDLNIPFEDDANAEVSCRG